MSGKTRAASGFALLAAALYAINIPVSKSLLRAVAPAMMAAFLYLGAGVGLALYALACAAAGKAVVTEPLTRAELPCTAAMVALDVAAPILLMLGIMRTSSANASLLSGFEIAATALAATVVFKEAVSPRLWAAIALITAASALLSFESADSLVFNGGSALVLAACVCWGFENNCTRRLSGKSSLEIVMIKGCFSGLGSLVVARALGEPFPPPWLLAAVALLGFVSYGLSINLYILAQKELGAAKTSAYYSIAPFIGAVFGMVFLGERPGSLFYVAFAVMALAAFLVARDGKAQ